METAGLWMLAAMAVALIATGLPAWMLLIGVAMAFALTGVACGAFSFALLSALPSRLLGLLEHDLLQALPLYVLMGALLNRLPLADVLFRAGARALARSGAGAPLAGLGLGVLLAPMNGSAGAAIAMLARTVQPRLDAAGVDRERGAALVCMAGTLGIVVPPSLVLILLGDALLRAHTEALNAATGAASGAMVRIVNTQDVFHGALVPAALLLVLCAGVAWWSGRARGSGGTAPGIGSFATGAALTRGEWFTAAVATAGIVVLLGAVALGYLYAVEAAAAGGVALFVYGVASGALTRERLMHALRDTMAVTGALFALLVGATTFTLVVRGFGTDRWIGDFLAGLGGGPAGALAAVLGMIALCAFVLDAFEMIFVVLPLLLPPLLVRVPDAVWVATLTLLILQASFLAPPFGYAVMMVRNRTPHALDAWRLARALLPYLFAQLVVLAAVLVFPGMLWREAATLEVRQAPDAQAAPAPSGKSAAELLDQQLREQEKEAR